MCEERMTEHDSRGLLMVFMKYPEKGTVKTRLARDMGEDRALAVYNALLRYTLEMVASMHGVDVCLFFAASDPDAGPPAGSRNNWRIVEQSSGDLGERLSNAFRTVLGDGPRKAVVIGADCVGLGPGMLGDAFASLDGSDIVIGPSEDGGYYLMGMKRFHDVFRGIPWSTERVFTRTMERMEALGLRAAILPVLYDVDTKEDWERAIREDDVLRSIMERMEEQGDGR